VRRPLAPPFGLARALVAIVVAGGSTTACGGIVAIDESAIAPPDAGTADVEEPVPLFGDGGITVRSPVPCQPCETNAVCGVQASCVAAEGPSFCAPGCSKEGFCAVLRTCTPVSDPEGHVWYACMPEQNPCAIPARPSNEHLGLSGLE
jgi:hypothetical protein